MSEESLTVETSTKVNIPARQVGVALGVVAIGIIAIAAALLTKPLMK